MTTNGAAGRWVTIIKHELSELQLVHPTEFPKSIASYLHQPTGTWTKQVRLFCATSCFEPTILAVGMLIILLVEFGKKSLIIAYEARS